MTTEDVPNFLFFSQKDLLRALLSASSIRNINIDDLCNFRVYCKERALSSHTRTPIEEKLCENEIGGVILGSLASGIKKCPLNREEYLEEKRSNITNKTKDGKSKRNTVYNEFENYKKWKVQRNLYDMNDVVLMLLNDLSLLQCFDSGTYH